MKTPIQLNIIYSDVMFPWWRMTIIYCLSELSDKEYQRRQWQEYFWDEARSCFEDLDCDCKANLETFINQIESVLVNKEESGSIYKLNILSEKIVEQIGIYKEATAYLTSPLWDDLVACAKEALEIFLKNEEAAKKTCVYPWHLGEDPDEWAKKKTEKLKELEASQNEPPPS